MSFSEIRNIKSTSIHRLTGRRWSNKKEDNYRHRCHCNNTIKTTCSLLDSCINNIATVISSWKNLGSQISPTNLKRKCWHPVWKFIFQFCYILSWAVGSHRSLTEITNLSSKRSVVYWWDCWVFSCDWYAGISVFSCRRIYHWYLLAVWDWLRVGTAKANISLFFLVEI